MADLVYVTQAGSEVWVVNAGSARITHVGTEVWLSNTGAARVTHIGVEVWRSVAVAVAFTPSGGRKRQTTVRRPKQHAAFQAAAHRRRSEVTSLAQTLFPAPRKHTGGVFFKKRNARRPWDKRRRAVFVGNAVALKTGISKSTRFARFFVKKPSRRPRNVRLHAAILLYVVLSGQRRPGAKLRFFRKRSYFRFGGHHARGVSLSQAEGYTYLSAIT